MRERGFDVSMQVFMGDTGATAGMIMTSFGSADAAEVGRMLDARTEDWVANIVSKLDGKREMVHGFSHHLRNLLCSGELSSYCVRMRFAI